MPDPARSVRRLETATVLLLLAGAVALAIVVHDAVRFHGDAAQVETLVLALGACAGTLYLGVAAGRAMREARRQVALLRALSVEREIQVDGRSVTVVQGSRAAAFCGGLLHPRIYLSDAAARGLAPDELRAVVAHEAHHADRHDPLRLLVARALGGPAAALAAVRRHALLADLAADAAAVQRLGSPAPLAGALLAFDADTAGVAPERVDVLAAPGTGDAVPLAILVAAALAFALLLGAGILLIALPWHPAGSLPLCAVTAALLPALAWLAARVLLLRR